MPAWFTKSSVQLVHVVGILALLLSGLFMFAGSLNAEAFTVHSEEQRIAYIKKRIRESGPKKHFNPENYSTQDYIMLGLLIFITMDGLVLYPKLFGAK